MVKGLEKFRAHFSSYSHCYALIGGTACALAMEEAGLDFRATRDLDIVLCVEVLDRAFVEAFWQFIKQGGYQHRQKSTGKPLFYRFHDPSDLSYPEMLELFSRKPAMISLNQDGHLTPIPMEEEVSSLSAILLNDEYYHWVHEGRREVEGLAIVDPIHLIPLKARAWLDLSARRTQGARIDEKEVKKHKNDILRLYQLLSADMRISLPPLIQKDLEHFLSSMQSIPVDLKNLGIKNRTFHEVLHAIAQIYGLQP